MSTTTPTPRTITIIGSLNSDLLTITPRLPSGGETLTATSFSTGAGGKGANQAVACARLSRPNPSSSSPTTPQDAPITIKMLGAVGQDTFGPSLINGLKNDGIDTSGIHSNSTLPTGVAVIIVESSTGENRILLNPGANHSLLASHFTTLESLGSPFPDLIILQLEIPLETVLQIIETAKLANVDVLLNPAPAVGGLPESVWSGLEHLVLNESEAAILTGRSVEEVEAEGFDWNTVTTDFIARGVRNVVVTLGSKGAFFHSERGDGKGVLVEAEKVEKVVDTTAAGDTFVGAYAIGVVRKRGWVGWEDVKWACQAAGRTVEREGAQSAIPWADEVERRK